jgi:uncharacterized protein YkwD
MLAFLAATLAAACPATPGPTAILCEVNRIRAHHHRPPVVADDRLARAAGGHARDMVDRHYFAHDTPGGANVTDRVARTGWLAGHRAWWLGEVLAWGAGPASRPRTIVIAWMHSPPHRAVLLDARYRAVGIGVARGTPPGGRPGATYAADFGARATLRWSARAGR